MSKNKKKYVPMRMCIQTREKLPKRELARFVYITDKNKVIFDPHGKARGRGANLKKSLEIFDQAVSSNAFTRAFKTKISKENLAEIREEFEKFLTRDSLKNDQQKVSVRIKVEDKVKLE